VPEELCAGTVGGRAVEGQEEEQAGRQREGAGSPGEKG
jgi:hypothetical protein